ncbi:TAT (twin-arginine translocation) pathway signal sequence domain protein [Campylobacter insulaenigrae]|nr:TAT (twin-arginine translocation) pathway signal sequence domain protein [Campylobacter insulaenigrae]
MLGFKAIDVSIEDNIVVPDGYEAKLLISWGDKLFSKAKPYDENKLIDDEAVKNASFVFGDNNDGMSFFLYLKQELF